MARNAPSGHTAPDDISEVSAAAPTATPTATIWMIPVRVKSRRASFRGSPRRLRTPSATTINPATAPDTNNSTSPTPGDPCRCSSTLPVAQIVSVYPYGIALPRTIVASAETYLAFTVR